MDPSQLSDAELMQVLFGRMRQRPNQPQPQLTPTSNATSAPPPAPIPPSAPSIAPLTTARTNPLGAITPYHGVRLPSQAPGHAPQTMLQSVSQPFLGRDNLAINMSGQVNQQRRASAAASQPRQPRLPSRRRHGPAIAPPSLPRNSQPCIDDCLSTTISDSVEIRTLRIKFKIYPPQVSMHHRVALLINNTADVHHFHRRLTVTLSLTGSYEILGMRSWNHTTFYTCTRFRSIPASQP